MIPLETLTLPNVINIVFGGIATHPAGTIIGHKSDS